MATEETGNVAAGAAEQSGGMPQLNFDTWASQIFWTAVALFILYKILNRSILPRISGALEDRHNAIADDLDRADELKREAETATETHRQGLADARASAQKIIDQQQEEIDAELAAAEAEAEAEIAAKLAESEKRISEIRAEASGNAQQIARETARSILEKIAPGLANSDALDAAVARALEKSELSS